MLKDILNSYSPLIEKKLSDAIENFGQKTSLRDACEYALLNGGKRFRPALVLMVAKAVGRGYDASEAALAIEFFHTASLIADDLPCMDNDDMRRNKPSLHKVQGEATALLATYALISAGYECLSLNARSLAKQHPEFREKSAMACLLALENASFNTGFLGATGGQFLDINPPDLKAETIRKVIEMKTGSLFETAFVLGWLYGGGDHGQLALVKKAAQHFGMAFQIADDIKDCDQDAINGRSVNLASVCGLQKAQEQLLEEIKDYLNAVEQLNIDSRELVLIAKNLSA